MLKICVINGPNLNMLGQRDRTIYGNDTLEEIKKYTEANIKSTEVKLEWFQSNSESELIFKIQSLEEMGFDGLVINPGAFSHTSIGILDAMSILDIPITEVHLSNTHKREGFRSMRLTAKSADTIMEGLGKKAYLLGVISQLLEVKNVSNN